MFQNNNGAVIKRLAKSSLRANKRRNIMTIVTIALAVALMMAIALIPIEIKQQQKNDEEGTAQAVFLNVPENSINKLKSSPDIEWAGEQYSVGSLKEKDYTLTVAYCDQAVLKASKLSLQGKLPQKSDEILVEPSFLSQIGSKAKIGDALSLNLGDGVKKEYRITGIIDQQSNDTGKYVALVSKAYVEKQKGTGNLSFNTYISVKNADALSETELKQKVYVLAGQLNIPQNDVTISTSRYRILKSNTASDILGYIVIAAIILFAAAIVIYSIFYIAVAGKIKQYGQLRTIGTTKKQIRKIVYREGMYLSAIGIPAGLIVGGLAGYFMIPKGWNFITALLTAAIVGFIGLLFVLISIRTPVRIAANTSPMEAVRYSAYQGKIKKNKSKKLHRKITPIHLAFMNFSRNRKKSLLTILSLGFSGILLVCVASMVGSYAPENDAKRDFPYGEYIISISGDGSDTFSDGRIQMNNPLNQSLKDKILSTDGVKDVKIWSNIEMKYSMPNGADSSGTIEGFSQDELSLMKPYLTDGTLDYNTLVAKNGVVVSSPKVFKESYGWNVKIGDKIKATILNSRGEKTEKELTVMALLSGNYRAGNFYWMPSDTLHALTGMDCNSKFEVVTEKQKEKAVGESLQKIVDTNSNLELDSLQEQIRYYSTANRPIYIAFYIMTIFIALFGIINLLNTMVTNLITRKQEIGVLQAVGLSGLQLNRMLQMEGLLYTAGTAVLTLTVGTGLGYVVCMIVKNLGMAIRYRFPVLPVCIFIVILLLVQLAISTFTVQNLKKQSLVERIHDAE
jgi:putative ABC transport system permease protein